MHAYTSGISIGELNDTNSVAAYIDTACNGHLLPVKCLSNVKEETDVSVIGVNEGGLKVTHSGFCNRLGGKGWAPNGNKYLVSMPQLDKIGCTSSTGNGVMTVYDRDKKVMLIGKMNKHDMYECRIEFIKQISMSALIGEDEEFEQVIEKVGNLNTNVQDTESDNVPTTGRYMNSILRDRAILCRKVHNNLHHPNDTALGDGLDNGCYLNTKLTSHDLRNSNKVLGGCEVCIESKMTAPDEPESINYHDDALGATLYCDWVVLPVKTVGGNKWILVAVEMTTGFIMVAGSKGKTFEDAIKAEAAVIAVMNSYGHKV